MIKDLIKTFAEKGFYLAAAGFIIMLPISPAMVSVFAGAMLGTALIQNIYENKKIQVNGHNGLYLMPAVFGLYLLSSILGAFQGTAWYDLKKTLFYLVIPFSFMLGKPFTKKQIRILFYWFSAAIVFSIMVAMVRWLNLENKEGFEVHRIGFVSHIRFSFQLILLSWFLFLFLRNNNRIQTKEGILLAIILLISLFFLFFQQSLTGLIAFAGSVIFYFIYINLIRKRKGYVYVVLASTLVVAPAVYMGIQVKEFYDIEEVNAEKLDRYTKAGNRYLFDLDNKTVENGSYVFHYICDDELREEWNKRSKLDYDLAKVNGYSVTATLYRYMTSKGLRKDAEGMKAMSDTDIMRVEQGMSNYIYASKFSLKPRIYQTIWEYYEFTHTGNANSKSFSQRIEFSNAAIWIIKNNFWTGVGTANWKSEFAKAFQHLSKNLDSKHYASSHNQYLNFMVKFGVLGLLLLIFFFIYPLLKSKAYQNTLFLVFLVFIGIANMGDSNLESHMGSSFFLYFYCLFIVNGQRNFLILDRK